MIKDLLSHLGGIENYGILSLLIFFAFFFGMLIWALLLRKPFLNRMAQLPLDDDPDPTCNESHRHE
jgi:hypothetical protein